MSRKTICLNMIVKNESKIITRLFDSVIDIIDTYVICDTGSDDDTPEIIKKYFNQKNIHGEVIYKPFKNFGYNRTYALQYAKNKADYILLLDADMKIVIDSKFNKHNLNANVYKILQINSSIKYYNIRLIRSNLDVSCIGVTHEYYDTKTNNTQNLDNIYIDDIGDGGSKTDKYERDIKLLLKGIEDEPNNTRYHFYLSQSYKDSGDVSNAIKWYTKTLDLNGWIQEKYYSCLMLGDLYLQQGNDKYALKFWLKSIEYDSERIEGIVKACEWGYTNSNHCLVNALYHRFHKYNHNPKDKLFLFYNLYNYHLEYYNSISSFYVNDKQNGYESCKSIILYNGYKLEQTFNNFIYYIDYLKKDKDELLVNKIKEYLLNRTISLSKRTDLWNKVKDHLKKYKKVWKEIDREMCYYTQNTTTDIEFIHITKTAGTSIEDWGEAHDIKWSYKNKDYLNMYTRKKYIQSSSWHVPPKYFDVNPYQNKITFTIVRNPYTRVISEFYCPWIGHKTTMYLKTSHSKENFNRWIQYFLQTDRCHGIPQVEYTPVDHVLKFESLQEDFTNFILTYGKLNLNIEDTILPRSNHTQNKIFTVNDLTEETVQQINKKYEKDFILFQYKMIH